MKKTILYGLVSSGILLLTAGCNEEWNTGSGTQGSFRPVLSLDANPLSSRGDSRADGDGNITAEDLALRLTSSATGTVSEWNSVSDYDMTQTFNVGTYTLEAYYGDKSREGFELPYYYGVTQFTIKENQTTPVSLTAGLGNAMVSITYTEAFMNYFTDYSTVVKTLAGNEIAYAAAETRPVYVAPGSVILKANVTKPNGTSMTVEALNFVAEARHHYNVKIDANGGEVNKFTLSVTYDDTFTEETVDIELDDIENTPAPTLEADGFTGGDSFDAVVGNLPAGKFAFVAIARAGLASVVLETASTSLTRQGWPEKVDLMAADASTRALLGSMGLVEMGVWNKPDMMAVVDLTQVISHISYVEGSDNATTFSLTVTDKLARETAPVTFTVNLEKLTLELSNPGALLDEAGQMSVDLTYNGADPANEVVIEYANDRGTWNAATIDAISPVSRASTVYRVDISGLPANSDAVTLRARTKALDANGEPVAATATTLTVQRSELPFSIEVNENDVFATHATLTAATTTLGLLPSLLAAQTTEVQLSTDGGETFKAYAYSVDGLSLTIEGLNPATTYTARLYADRMNSKKIRFTTEAAAQLPNGNLDNGWDTYTKKAGANTSSCTVHTIEAPWATNNDLTISKMATVACSGSALCATQVTGDSKSGNAALIRTVGYGMTTALSKPTSFAVGELFLGEYNGGAKYGTSFLSRPSALSFQYKYTPYTSSEKGVATVEILDGNGNVLSNGALSLNAASGYTLATIPLSYTANAGKAATIKVIFKSTNVNASSSVCSNKANTYNYGSALYIDDITLNY